MRRHLAGARVPLDVLTLVAVVLVATGCATLGVRTEGTSGPIAWHVENIAVVTRDQRGRPVDGQAFTVVLRNVSDHTLTFTQMDEVRSRPQTQPVHLRSADRWEMKPGGERRIERFTSLVCNDPSGCSSASATQSLMRFVLTGRDSLERPVEVRIDITLPPATTGQPPMAR